ncbi:hypothetical protein RN001_007274 [Aquatica leii]|uniref:HTTM-like domain-containing protein n=1 Tax=Aquatica leii TaxID=1421715 RepID=A0AAN7P9B9_9COLE|nr:hypothetical protein RN001_007274 [Aquatica leii]
MYQPRHASSLGIIRILFGMLMIIDTLFERSGLEIIYRWGDNQDCHFPLFPQMQIPSFFTLALIYGTMIAGAVGIALGYKFRYSTFMYASCYWYLLLLDKTYWNNHSYLFGLVSIILLGSSANATYSIDSLLDSAEHEKTVPFWNYFILRFQFFILYFIAGLKKTDIEWLSGYAMLDLGHHWVFEPFKFILSTEKIDFFVIHLVGFLLDLTIGFWLISPVTRCYAMVFSTMFHIMNSRLFSIGMFPYVCIATTPIFCKDDWPEQLYFLIRSENCKNQDIYPQDSLKEKRITVKQRFLAFLLLTYCGIQFFLPYSHEITKGYTNWTKGLYGYSWDMMIHSWNSGLVVLRVLDNANGEEYFIDPDVWTQNQRWSKHADMCVQYAQCLKNNLMKLNGTFSSNKHWPVLSNNISIYIDVWCSLNKRFQQRMFDPYYDLLTAKWSPFEKVEWLLPLMTESDEFRSQLQSLEDHVYSWSNYSDVLFVADFPGMYLENYLTDDLVNVTLTILGGEVIYETELQAMSIKLTTGSNYVIPTNKFHKIYTNGIKPSFYMYTFVNQTLEKLGNGA